jgi:signal transduction histidine kinase
MSMAKPMHLVPRTDRKGSGGAESDVWSVESGEVRTGPAAFALHDAKNMAAVLQANLDYLSDTLAAQPKSSNVAAALEDARESARRLGMLLREALVALQGSPPSKTQPAALRVAPVIASLIERVAPMASARGVRVVTGGTEEAAACIDRDLFERAILNLIDNALRFSKPGDTIEIEYLAQGDRTVVAVADEGPGVPEAMRESVFASERKVPTSAAETNFGLGLAFCREVAIAHEGNAWVFNRVSGGACFVFEVRAPA